jgi:hypothetical protein
MKRKREILLPRKLKGRGFNLPRLQENIHIINVRRKIAIFAILILMNPLNPNTNPGYPSLRRKFSLSQEMIDFFSTANFIKCITKLLGKNTKKIKFP